MLIQKIQQLPKLPGVYLYKDKKGDIIYIGKAKNLRNRVKSYFQKQSNLEDKTRVLVKNIADIEWIVVRDEVEAFLTESNLIKEHRPRYNVLMKDDKTFPYIQITNEPYPQVKIVRMKIFVKDRHKYFGPYTDVRYLRRVMKAIHDIFHLRTCSYRIDKDSIAENRIKVCLDYHIKRCEGPCEGLVSERYYGDMIKQIELFLKGRNSQIKEFIKNLMQTASDELRFEDATRYRDQIIAVDNFTKTQKKVSPDTIDRDIVSVSSENLYGIGVVMRVRNGLFIGREKFNLKIIDSNNSVENLSQFLMQYYSSTEDIPKEIIIEHELEQKIEFEKWFSYLRNKKVVIINPIRGEKLKLLNTCKRNANLLLGEVRLKKMKLKELVPKMVLQLQEDLNLLSPPRRIEGFDNSNIQGSYPVASMVCFIDGKPRKKEYRKFNIKTVLGSDDFESMYEVVYRRYKRVLEERKPLPDLILVDGGKGQLSYAKTALDELGLQSIAVIGLAKKLEDVFVPESSVPQNISKTSPGLYLLRQIRDEAHRFAITFHRSKRDKAMLKSILESVKGLGKKRISTIWKNYESIDELKKDSVQEIFNKTKIPIVIIVDLVRLITKND
jgi:excinuclease ABC subunit C